jgi:hypothetical protein
MPVKAKLWHIYLAENCFHTDPPKDKYVVISHIDESIMGFLINSKITPWLSRHPNLVVCEAVITAQGHSFLKYNSFVDCQKIYPFYDWELTRHVGEVSPNAKLSILQALSVCPTLERKYKTAILSRDGHLLDSDSSD